MPAKGSRVFSRALKLTAARRMMAGENVSALSRELQVLRKDLHYWRTRFRAGGPEALRGKGRPGEIDRARVRIAELERKIGQQQVDLDFFDKPCGESRAHASRARRLARLRHLLGG